LGKGSIVIVHGVGEHSGRYAHVADYLKNHGYEVVIGDLPGFGTSSGRRGHVDSFEEYLDTVDGWLEKAPVLGGKLYLMGHSLGGLICMRYVQTRNRRIDGLILVSPGIQLRMTVPAWKKSLSVVLDKICPHLEMSNEVDSHYLCRDPEVISKYESDPLGYGKVTVHWYREFTCAGDQAVTGPELLVPTLVILGEKDPIVDAAWVQEYFRGKSNVAVRVFEDFLHEPLNEPEKAEVLETVVRWLNQSHPNPRGVS
jgi:lysophospholipase